MYVWSPTIAFVVIAPGGTSLDKKNKISITPASRQKTRTDSASYVSGLFFRYISNPGLGGASAQNFTLRVLFVFDPHDT